MTRVKRLFSQAPGNVKGKAMPDNSSINCSHLVTDNIALFLSMAEFGTCQQQFTLMQQKNRNRQCANCIYCMKIKGRRNKNIIKFEKKCAKQGKKFTNFTALDSELYLKCWYSKCMSGVQVFTPYIHFYQIMENATACE